MTSYSVLRAGLLSGAPRATELTDRALRDAERFRHLNAFLEVFESARASAEAVDARIRDGREGALAGMTIAVKDNICVAGERLSCASHMLEDFAPRSSATAVERLSAADAVLIGRTNMDEFAMGSSNENSAFGPVRNPVDQTRVPGGSSGGAAAAVAADIVHAALGSDTGGSVRQPAAFTGIVGVKPTYGRVSRWGLVAFASSFDQIGVLARSVEDAARVLEVIAGSDPRDATCASRPVDAYRDAVAADVGGLRIGLPEEYLSVDLQPDIRKAVERAVEAFRDAGATTVPISLPHTASSIPVYYVLATSEASSNLARYDGVRYGFRGSAADGSLGDMYDATRSSGFGREVRRRIMLGTYALSAGFHDAYYTKAQKVRRLIRDDFSRAFGSVDVILTPTAPTTAFRFGERMTDPLQMYLSDLFTAPASCAGVPAVSVPAGRDGDGLPIGLQLIANAFQESTMFSAAAALERAALADVV